MLASARVHRLDDCSKCHKQSAWENDREDAGVVGNLVQEARSTRHVEPGMSPKEIHGCPAPTPTAYRPVPNHITPAPAVVHMAPLSGVKISAARACAGTLSTSPTLNAVSTAHQRSRIGAMSG
jgi:hypothetical protein